MEDEENSDCKLLRTKIFEQALAAEESGKLALAGEHFEKCMSVDPNFARGWMCYAALLMKQREFSKAIDAAKHAIAITPKNSIAHSTLGQIYMEQELWLDAEKYFRMSLSQKQRVTTWVFLGFTLSELEREDEAIESYKSALRIEPEYDEAHYNLGCCYRLRGDYENAIHHLRRAITADPDYARGYAELGFALAHDNSNKDKLVEARQALEKSVALDATYGWSRIYLACVLERFGEFKAAGEQYETALRIWPDSLLAHSLYGQLLANDLNDRKGAEAHFKKAIALAPDHADAMYHLGGNLLNWNKRIEGERYLRRAAVLGHKKAMKILDGLGPYVPKQERGPSCPDCGAPWLQTGSWYCTDCGRDMRSKTKKKPGAMF